MSVDPRTPVLVGVGQVNHTGADAPEPVELLAEAARAAGADCGAPSLVAASEWVVVVHSLSRRYADPAALVARALGASPARAATTTDGGNTPQRLVDLAATAIAAGQLDVALIGGVETWRTRSAQRRRGTPSPWPDHPDDVTPGEVIGADLPMSSPHEASLGLWLPVQFYPLFESAIRARSGRTPAEHTRWVAELWSRFSEVAVENPYAVLPRAHTPEEIATPGPRNRMVGYPYTKLLNANNSVDQAAAVLVCSMAAAGVAGVPRDRWVFLHGAAEAADTAAVSDRWELDRSPAVAAAGRSALARAGVSADDLGPVDVYSCFPSAVQVAAAELGLDLRRPLTVTGGLTFAGGPWNNYVTHSLATMVARLRDDPEATGLVTANGGLLTKHAIGVYAARPGSGDGPLVADVQAEVDAGPVRPVATSVHGPAVLEAYTVMHDAAGEPETLIATCRLDDGRRAWGLSRDPAAMAAGVTEELAGRGVELDGTDLHLVG